MDLRKKGSFRFQLSQIHSHEYRFKNAIYIQITSNLLMQTTYNMCSVIQSGQLDRRNAYGEIRSNYETTRDAYLLHRKYEEKVKNLHVEEFWGIATGNEPA